MIRCPKDSLREGSDGLVEFGGILEGVVRIKGKV
jgi:hypothetical protein